MVGGVQDWINEQVGGRWTYRVSRVVVPATGGSILQPDPNRWGAIIMNVGTVALHMMIAPLDLAASGLILTPSGGSFATDVRDDLILPTLEWVGYGDAAATSAEVIEIVRYGSV